MLFKKNIISSSFRDPSGFLFLRNNCIYRQINIKYGNHYDYLMKSGLYETLVNKDLLIPHREVDIPPEEETLAYKIIQPEVIPFVSYPYEWCFSHLKDAALTTLQIQKIALQADMFLKDASAYNIQFRRGKSILIDTLSFERYKEGATWIAYRQFCQHFLAPLALMAYTDIRLNQLFRIYLDGIPLDLASKLLTRRTWLSFAILSHIHLHAKSQKHFGGKTIKKSTKRISKASLTGIIDNLETTIQTLDWKPEGTEWENYYENTNYSSAALNHKKELVQQHLNEINPKSVWDMGANTGLFSRLASERGIMTISFDIDPAAVEKNYRDVTKNKRDFILPLCLDLTNPSPGIGWQGNERMSLKERAPVDMIFALALIHHLAISNNLPFLKIAHFFSTLCRFLIIEFIPKNDSQVQRLLRTREDIFDHYDQNHFENSFTKFFSILKCTNIVDTQRVLYMMRCRNSKE